MKIKLDDTYSIEGDETNWVLMRINGKAYGYYSTIESLVVSS